MIGSIHQPLASFWARFFARLIDGLLFSIAATVVYHTLKPTNEYGANQFYNDVLGMTMLIQWIIYYPTMEGNGGTIGKRLLNMKTISTNGNKASLTKGFKKLLFMIMPLLLCIPILLIIGLLADRKSHPAFNLMFIAVIIEIVWMCLSPLVITKNGNRWHDDFAGLLVIKDSRPSTMSPSSMAIFLVTFLLGCSHISNAKDNQVSSLKYIKSFINKPIPRVNSDLKNSGWILQTNGFNKQYKRDYTQWSVKNLNNDYSSESLIVYYKGNEPNMVCYATSDKSFYNNALKEVSQLGYSLAFHEPYEDADMSIYKNGEGRIVISAIQKIKRACDLRCIPLSSDQKHN